MRADTQRHLDNILDCFGGNDGGVSFVKVKTLIEDMDKQADAGDKLADEVIDVLRRFSRLIDVAQMQIPATDSPAKKKAKKKAKKR